MTRRPWTAEEFELLDLCYQDTATAELAYLLDRGLSCVHRAAQKRGLKKDPQFIADTARERSSRPDHGGRATRFQKGLVPPNKGQKMPGWAPGRMRETQFKQGQVSQNWMPIGATRKIGGYLYRKVADIPRAPMSRNWKPEHILLWERKRGSVPAGHVVVFKDGNHDHIRISNLELISRADLMSRNTIHRLPPELKEVIHLTGVIKSVVTKRRKKHAEEQNVKSA